VPAGLLQPCRQLATSHASALRELARLAAWNSALEAKQGRKAARLAAVTQEVAATKAALADLASAKVRAADIDALYFELATRRCASPLPPYCVRVVASPASAVGPLLRVRLAPGTCARPRDRDGVADWSPLLLRAVTTVCGDSARRPRGDPPRSVS
jgi:hypothetical protein